MSDVGSKFSSAFSKFSSKASRIATGVSNEIQSIVNKNHRHDEAHEIEADNIRTAINESHRFKSFSNMRSDNFVKWHVDGADYFWAVSEMLEAATECIMIQDWWLTPELYLRRPPAKYPEYRIDRILKRRAEAGVKVYVIVYKEVTQGLALSSRHTKHHLHDTHPNIAVIRHPDHIGTVDSTRIWSHHEKVVIVDNHFAAVGGLDLCFGRWDSHAHPLADVHPTDFSRTLFPGQEYNNSRVKDFLKVDHFVNNAVSIIQTPRMAWHDVHMTLSGPSVLDIVQHFTERWNELKLRKHKDDSRFDWLAYPHDKLVAPNEPVHRLRHRDEWLEKGRKFRQRFHKGPEWKPVADDHHHMEPMGTCKVQVVRSCSDWSHGVLKESSIQNAYLELIREAEHYIYIENQFFISNTGDYGPVQNRIAQALVERIIRAAKEGKRFKVVVLIPEVPGFAGDIASSNDLKTILAATWRTINRGGHSIYEEVRAAGYEPKDYIRVYHLRSYDRINAPWPSFISEMEKQSGVTLHEAQIALAKQWVGEPTIWSQPKIGIQKPLPTQEGIVLENTKVEVEEVEFPKTVEEAVETIRKFESAAKTLRPDHEVSDSIAHHAMIDDTSLLDEKWLGTEQEELDAYVSEILYIHSKLMIVDDRRVICGSANINDRSQKGNGDSEIALVVEDTDMIDSFMNGEPYQVARFATTLRRRLYREHLGLLRCEPVDEVTDFKRPPPIPNPNEIGTEEDKLVADPMSEATEHLLNSTAQRNRAIFAELFKTVPSDTVRNFDQYKKYVPKSMVCHLAPGQSLERVKQRLSEVRGHVVECPLDFLIEETDLWQNASWNGLNPTLQVFI
ncbi:related to phospholipase D [Serendipita indica DSM 11827]|uniref:Phospholipase n=1 Tax=Serendipita indica (strain DSM 11827) TaxID=1109443 RepID=G4U2D0_SERID|nr:related to phospholipase D [Serendipita indica DSM 11827]